MRTIFLKLNFFEQFFFQRFEADKMDAFMEANCLNLIFSMKIIKIFRGSPITFQNGAHLLGVSLSKIEIIKIASIKTWKIGTLSSSSIYVEIVKNLIHQKSLLRFPCCVYICTSSTSNPPSTLMIKVKG